MILPALSPNADAVAHEALAAFRAMEPEDYRRLNGRFIGCDRMDAASFEAHAVDPKGVRRWSLLITLSGDPEAKLDVQLSVSDLTRRKVAKGDFAVGTPFETWKAPSNQQRSVFEHVGVPLREDHPLWAYASALWFSVVAAPWRYDSKRYTTDETLGAYLLPKA